VVSVLAIALSVMYFVAMIVIGIVASHFIIKFW